MKFPPEAAILGVARGSTRDAWLLYRIVYWQRYTKVKHNGHFWICKTQEEWADETGLPLRSVRRAFEALREKKVVITEQHRFGSKTMNFVRIRTAAAKRLGLWG